MGRRQCARILAASGAPLATGVARLGPPLPDNGKSCTGARLRLRVRVRPQRTRWAFQPTQRGEPRHKTA
eukprot:126451-Pyramimonas_sp.AAC.1